MARSADDAERDGWTAAAVVRDAVAGLGAGWMRVPRRARRAWWRTLAVGYAATCLLTAALVWAAGRLGARGLLAWEPAALRWIAREPPLPFSVAIWVGVPGESLVLWVVGLTVAVWAARRRRAPTALAFLLGMTLTYPPVIAAWLAWERERPRVIAGGIAAPGGFFNSYPSGHMAQTVVVYGLLARLWMRASARRLERLTAAVLAGLAVAAVAVSRLRLGAHWPSDVAAGTAIGLVWAAALVLALHRVRSRSRARAGGSAAAGDVA